MLIASAVLTGKPVSFGLEAIDNYQMNRENDNSPMARKGALNGQRDISEIPWKYAISASSSNHDPNQ